MKNDLNEQVKALAFQWDVLQTRQRVLDIDRAAVAGEITALVRKHGAAPPRATRLRVLRAEDGTELRVTTGQELRVDGSIALRLRAVLREAGCGRFFRRMFRRIESFVLAEGAHEFVTGLKDPSFPTASQVRRLFLAAIEERDKSPDIEVKRPEASPQRTQSAQRGAA